MPDAISKKLDFIIMRRIEVANDYLARVNCHLQQSLKEFLLIHFVESEIIDRKGVMLNLNCALNILRTDYLHNHPDSKENTETLDYGRLVHLYTNQILNWNPKQEVITSIRFNNEKLNSNKA